MAVGNPKGIVTNSAHFTFFSTSSWSTSSSSSSELPSTTSGSSFTLPSGSALPAAAP